MDDDYMYGQEEAEEEDDQDSEDEPKKGVAKTVEANLKQAIANSAKNASAKGVVSDESDIEDEEDLDDIDSHNLNTVTEVEYNANRIKNDIKTKCEKISSDEMIASFPTSEWTKLKDPFQIPTKIVVTKEFTFQNPFDKNGVLYYLGK